MEKKYSGCYCLCGRTSSALANFRKKGVPYRLCFCFYWLLLNDRYLLCTGQTCFRTGSSTHWCLSSLTPALTYEDYGGNKSFWCFQTYENMWIPFSVSFDCKWRERQAEGVPIMKTSNLILTNVRRREFSYSWKIKKRGGRCICVGKVAVRMTCGYIDQPFKAFHCTQYA